jgi:hypothetical protein
MALRSVEGWLSRFGALPMGVGNVVVEPHLEREWAGGGGVRMVVPVIFNGRRIERRLGSGGGGGARAVVDEV